jgi:hypothetical protein
MEGLSQDKEPEVDAAFAKILSAIDRAIEDPGLLSTLEASFVHLKKKVKAGTEDGEEGTSSVLLLVAEFLLSHGLHRTLDVLKSETRAPPVKTRQKEILVRGNPWLEILGEPMRKIVRTIPVVEKDLSSFLSTAVPIDQGILSETYDFIRRNRDSKKACASFLLERFRVEDAFVSAQEGKNGLSFSTGSHEFSLFRELLSTLVIERKDLQRKIWAWNRRRAGPPEPPGLEVIYMVGKSMAKLNELVLSNEPMESTVPRNLVFHSVFVCPVLRTECSPDNFPALLSCGHVLSIRAIERIASFRGSIFKCPYCPVETNTRDILRLTIS